MEALMMATANPAMGRKVREMEPEYMPVDKAAPETSLRRLEALLRLARGKECASQVGFMKLRGEITAAQFDACEWYAELRKDYLLAIDAKEIKSGSAELVSKSEPPDPFSAAGRRKAKRDRETIADFRSVELAGMACGRGEYLMFKDVVLDGAIPTWGGRRAVQVVSEAIHHYRVAASRFRRGRRDSQ